MLKSKKNPLCTPPPSRSTFFKIVFCFVFVIVVVGTLIRQGTATVGCCRYAKSSCFVCHSNYKAEDKKTKAIIRENLTFKTTLLVAEEHNLFRYNGK